MAPVLIQSRLKSSVVTLNCPLCRVSIEYNKPSTSQPECRIACAACHGQFNAPASSSGSSSSKPGNARTRKIGTQAQPLDLLYYDTLEVKPDADADAIKRAYRRLALRHHPDKLTAEQRTPQAEEKFKTISVAYAVLSNPEERAKYNEFGPASKQQENGFIDPEQVFSSLFGGERFQDLIGKVSIGAEMKSALQKEQEDGGAAEGSSISSEDAAKQLELSKKSKKDMTPEERESKRQADEAKRAVERAEAEERAKIREERVVKLIASLLKKIAIFTEEARAGRDPQVEASVKAIWAIEAEELKQESYGVELLNSVGAAYLQKSRQYASSQSTLWGVGGWYHGVKNTAALFSETVSTLRSAYELTDIFKELAAADEKGLSDEKRKELEEKVATKGMQALFKGCKLEVESVVREVCERILYDPSITREIADKRAAALEILGTVYSSVQKDGTDSEWTEIKPKVRS